MKSFEEEFPSLIGQDDGSGYYGKDNISTNCLDKERVRQAIEKLRRGDTTEEEWKTGEECYFTGDKLLKELGL